MLPPDPSEDELARHWSLTPADLAVIAECCGPDHRRRFALQLCAMRAYGRFLDDYRHAPIKIVNHLSRQLGLLPVLFLDRPGREPTERVQAQRIRRYLALCRFDKAAEANLREWLRAGALEGRTAGELLIQAEEKLRGWQVMLPGASTLDRIVNSVVAHTTADLFATIVGHLPTKLRADINLLVEVPEGDARSSLFRLKDYPKSANAAVIKGDIVRLRLIEDLLSAGVDLGDLDPRIIRQLGQLGRRYDVRRTSWFDAGDLRRLAKPKRDALVACYLVEARKMLLDRIVEMNDLFLTGMNRRARTSVEKRRKSLRRRARDGLHRVLGTVDALVAADGAQSVAGFRDAQNPPALIEAAIACRAYERLEARGHLDAVAKRTPGGSTGEAGARLARYGTLRQYLPAFFALPFQAAAGSETLLRAVESLRALDAGTRGPLTTDDPHGFVQADWRPYLVSDGKLDRAIWEILLAFAVRDALRAGSLFLAHSRDHVSFWNLVYDDSSWQQAREQAYQRLDLPTDGQAFLARLGQRLNRAARAAQRGLPAVRLPRRDVSEAEGATALLPSAMAGSSSSSATRC